MKRSEVIKLFNAFNNIKKYVDKDGNPIKLNKYLLNAIIVNNKKLEADIEAIKEVEKDLTKNRVLFEQKRIEINKKYAKKDNNGEAIINDNKYIFESDETKQKMVNELNEIYTSIKNDIINEEKEYIDYQNEDASIKEDDLIKIKIDWLPDDITSHDHEWLSIIIEKYIVG